MDCIAKPKNKVLPGLDDSKMQCVDRQGGSRLDRVNELTVGLTRGSESGDDIDDYARGSKYIHFGVLSSANDARLLDTGGVNVLITCDCFNEKSRIMRRCFSKFYIIILIRLISYYSDLSALFFTGSDQCYDDEALNGCIRWQDDG